MKRRGRWPLSGERHRRIHRLARLYGKTQMNPYDENRVAINSNYFSRANVELENTVVNLVPTRGAVVKATFVTHVGYRVLFTVTMPDGKPAPFGAMASADLESGTVTGIVGDNGELYLSGMPAEGHLRLRVILAPVLHITIFLNRKIMN